MIDIFDIIEKMRKDPIPSGQSFFQDEMFGINSELTTARKKRKAKLQLGTLTETYIEVEYNYKIMDINIVEMEENNKNMSLSKFDIARNELKIKKLQMQRIMEENKLNDLDLKIKHMWKMYESFGEISREEFEDQEEDYYTKKIAIQLAGLDKQGKIEFAMMGKTEEDVHKVVDFVEKDLRNDKKLMNKKLLKEDE